MTQNTNMLSRFQMASLVLLRILIGWHMLYEGLAKLLMPNWSAASFLVESKWILSGFAQWILSDNGILQAVNFMNTWGLIAIGLGLILGLFTRPAAYAGALLLLIYYLNNPPLIGLEYNMPSEGNYLIVSKTLIEAAALLFLGSFPTGKAFGLDIFVARLLKSTKAKRG